MDENVSLLCLDTALPGSDAGAFDPVRLDWLAQRLHDTADRRVLVFTHHPPGLWVSGCWTTCPCSIISPLSI